MKRILFGASTCLISHFPTNKNLVSKCFMKHKSYFRRATSANSQWRRAMVLTTGGTLATYYLFNSVREELELIAEETIIAPTQSTEQQKEIVKRSTALGQATKPGGKPRVVILGSGWGAMAVVEKIDGDLFDVIIVSPRNYFLFTPMLPSTAVGTVEMRSVLEPTRRYLQRRLPQAHYFEAKCSNIDHQNKIVTCVWEDISAFSGVVEKFDIAYDYLVIAVGAHVNTFNTPGVVEHCHFMKEINHARNIRKRTMDILEAASLPGTTEDELRQLLHFVVVGGGPTGVEFSGELRDFLHYEIKRFFPELFPYLRITLVQSADHILNTMAKSLSEIAEKRFKLDGINVVTLSRVIEVRDKEIVVFDKGTNSTKNVPYGLCVWTTGIKQTPLIERLLTNLPSDQQKNNKAILTDNRLRVKGVDDSIFAVGDCSTIDQPRLLSRVVELFKEADINGDGQLDLFEITAMFEKKSIEFPQMLVYNDKLLKLYRKFDISGDDRLDLNEFKAMLEEVDKEITALPATAQVASREGVYVGKYLNELQRRRNLISNENANKTSTSDTNIMIDYPAFHFKNQGIFAYIGSHEAVAEVGGHYSGGFMTWLLYRSVYLSKQVSLRNRFALASDWTKTLLFGRDISRF